MEPYVMEGENQLPRIVLDKAKGHFEISGQSLPENVHEFYSPVIAWLDEYGKSPNPKTEVTFKMEYYNTASSKMLFAILEKFDEIFKAGHDVKIFWHYDQDDEDMLESGEDYADLVKVPFEFISYIV
ncbi:MAG: DUF1987 domain-containing protein [Bacteroidales bacterium]|nr:DUF1987 domain-containing protein [Bacteroidales bacterium]